MIMPSFTAEASTLHDAAALPLCSCRRRRTLRLCPCSVPTLRAIRRDVRRNRSRLLSGVEVYIGARRAGHLRAGLVPLFSMH